MRAPTALLSRLSGDEFDRSAAIAGLVVSLALVPLWLVTSEIYVRTIPVAVAGACLLYLASVRRVESPRRETWTFGRDGVVPAQITGVGLAVLAVATILVGGRPVPILLLSGGIGSLLLFQIAFLDDGALRPALVLPQILVYGLVTRFTALYTTPGLIGVDSWTHVTGYAASIARTGSLAPIADVKYYTAPFYHVLTAAGAELLGVPLRTALYLVVGGALLFSVVFVYATARYVTTVRWALFATAVFAVADQVVRWGLHVIPTSLGLVFFLGVVFFVVRILHAETGWADLSMLVVFGIAATLTHHVSAFVTLVFLGTSALAELIVRYSDDDSLADVRNRPREAAGMLATLPGVFLVHAAFTVVLWAATPFYDSTFLFRMAGVVWSSVSTSVGAFDFAGSPADAAGEAPASAFAASLAASVDAAGFLVLLFVTVIGSLALLRRHRAPRASYTFVGATGVMIWFALVLPVFGVRELLPGRWFAFMYALMAVIGAVGLHHVATRFSPRAVAVGLAVLILVLPGAMVTAEKATLDDPTFDDQWPKYAYTESELAAVDTIGETAPASASAVYTDHPYRTVFPRTGAHPADTINLDDVGESGTAYSRVVYRTYQSGGAPQFVTASGAVVVRHLDREQTCPPTRNYVYDNQNVLLCTSSDV